MMDKAELLANQELGTYLDGLKDALKMTKPQLRKAISIIINDDTDTSAEPVDYRP